MWLSGQDRGWMQVHSNRYLLQDGRKQYIQTLFLLIVCIASPGVKITTAVSVPA